MARTTRWARRCAEAPRAAGQLRFGIVQGGTDLALRRAHLAEIAALPFDGLALGGLGVGEPPPVMHEVVGAIAPAMPAGSPALSHGRRDARGSARRHPRRHRHVRLRDADAQRAQRPALRARGPLNIANAQHRDDARPVEEGCPCECCASYSRAYLSHLFHAKELLYYRLATIHNLQHYLDLARRARAAIIAGVVNESSW